MTTIQSGTFQMNYQVDVKAEMEMTVMASRIRDMERKLHRIHHDLLVSQPDKNQEARL